MAPTILKFLKPRHRQKLALFDFDWTLVKPMSDLTFPKNIDDWEWLRPEVPDIVRGYYKKGYAIIIFTNQSKKWKQAQIETVAKALDIPCTVAIAFDKSDYKPNRALFDAVIGDKKWDSNKSFFVGDALGRPADFADSDLKFGKIVGVKVHAPEDMFPFPENEGRTISAKPYQEVIVMVGYPGSGKSTIAKKHFPKYAHIDGDVLKTPAKMLEVGRQALREGKSVVFDATNPTSERRKQYIKLADEMHIPVRCVHVNTSMEEAIARNNKREIAKGVPKIAFYTYRKRFEHPTELEGFESVVTV